MGDDESSSDESFNPEDASDGGGGSHTDGSGDDGTCPVPWCDYSRHDDYLGFCSAHFKTHGEPEAVVAKIRSDRPGTEPPGLESLKRRHALHEAWDEIKRSIDALESSEGEEEGEAATEEAGALSSSSANPAVDELSNKIESHMLDVAALDDKIEFDPSPFLAAIRRCVDRMNVSGIEALCIRYPDSFPCGLDNDSECVLDHYASRPPRAVSPMGLALHHFVGKSRSGKPEGGDRLRKLFLESPLINPETVPAATLCDAVYMGGGQNDFILDLCRRGNVTKKVVDAAKYLNKSPANVSTPERREMLRGVESIMKEQQKAKREEAKKRKREEEEEAMAKEEEKEQGEDEAKEDDERGSRRSTRRRTRGSGRGVGEDGAAPPPPAASASVNDKDGGADTDAPFLCEKKGTILSCSLAFPNLSEGGAVLDDWTCGAIKSGDDHNACCAGGEGAAAATEGVRKQCEALTKQLNTWRPEHDASEEPWRAFFITDAALGRLVATPSEDEDKESAVYMSKVAGGLLRLDHEGGKDERGYNLEIKDLKDSRKTFFHNRWYYGHLGNRIDKKALNKTKTATNYFKAATANGTRIQATVRHEGSETYGWGLVLVGRAKKIDGCFAIVFTDCEQDHYHHGSG